LWFHHVANVKVFYISAKYHPAFFYRICIVFTNFTVSNSKIENMKLGKWIGGIMGFMAMGPLGALAGYAIGSLFDKAAYAPENMDAGNETYTGQRNSFLFSLLVMASYIIRADGKIMHSEMEFVRRFLRTNFGEDAVAEGEQILLNLFEQRKRMEATNPYAFQNTIRECGAQIAANMSYEERLQLLSFLAQIARSDGNVCAAEINALKEVAQSMQLSAKEVESMLNLSGNSLEEAYKVLEVEPTATDDEVRAAYRRLALKHHPDRVATLGEDIRKAAEEKFQSINNAKERIYKARGMK
jgi:DnaJ like chaperone protein